RCIEARHFWQLHIHEDEIRQLLLRLGDAGFAVDGFDQPVRSAAHQLTHDFPVVLVVFDVKNCPIAHVLSPFVRSGTAKKNVQPLPISLSTHIRPSCISTNFLVMLSPSPVLPNSRVTVAST